MSGSELRPMRDFDPAQPAILHNRISDDIKTWTGEDAADYRKNSVTLPDGAVQWREFVFDGWGQCEGG